jgi:hypothetical protein
VCGEERVGGEGKLGAQVCQIYWVSIGYVIGLFRLDTYAYLKKEKK